ncbi:lysophospholipid acyltransferase family protein [Campylobacter vicugnae]|uniref:lysophospholipid acyltransferase family protein n=1 Tax=Campylobacter vicugnae TaxID=1660076 RepID=UPI000A335BDD|nr:lysophospholipid acyltransferase family protein [Campylobacter sp. S0112]
MARLFKGKLANKIIENLLVFLIKLIYLTCKKEFIGNQPKSKPVVALFWHEKLAFMPFIFDSCWQGREANVMISDHKDGQMISDIIKHFGIGSIRGSSSKGALKVFLSAIKSINNGVDVVITPDGPRGPRHSISDGSVTIAQKTGVNVVVLSYKASKFWQFNSWDKMILPKPFSKLTYYISSEFSLEGLNIQEAKNLIVKKFDEVDSII